MASLKTVLACWSLPPGRCTWLLGARAKDCTDSVFGADKARVARRCVLSDAFATGTRSDASLFGSAQRARRAWPRGAPCGAARQVHLDSWSWTESKPGGPQRADVGLSCSAAARTASPPPEETPPGTRLPGAA